VQRCMSGDFDDQGRLGKINGKERSRPMRGTLNGKMMIVLLTTN